MTEQKKANNKSTLILVSLVFLLPFVLALLALKGEWFNRAATNKGKLLQPPVVMSDLLKGEKPVWRLVYVIPETCLKECENAIYSLKQVWQASGREKQRVVATLLSTEASDATVRNKASTDPQLTVLSVSNDYLQSKFQQESSAGIFIADTLGNVILKYPLSLEQQQAVLQGRDILGDLRKLLKLSRIG